MTPETIPSESFRLLFDSSMDAVLLTTPDGMICAANPAACEIFGMSEAEIRAAGRSRLTDTSAPRFQSLLEVRSRTGKARSELTCTRKDGSTFIGDVSSVIAKDGARAFVIIRDITPQKLAEEALRVSQRRLVEALKGAQAGVWEVDLQTRETCWAEGMADLLGIDPDTVEHESKRWEEYIHPQDRENLFSLVSAVCEAGTPAVYQFRAIRGNGESRWHASHCSTVNNGAKLVGVSYDITDSKRVEEALRESERKLRIALDSAEMGTFEIDAATGTVSWDKRTCELFGRSPHEAPTLDLCSKVVFPEDWGVVQDALATAFDPGGDGRYEAEFRVRRPDHTTVWILAKGRVHFEGEGENRSPLRLNGVNIDITQRKVAEEALRQSEEKFRVMGEILPFGVWLCNADGEAEYVSPSFLELLNMTEEEQKGLGWSKRLVPEDLPGMLEKWSACVKTGREWDSEHRIIDRYGDIKTVLTRGRPVRDNSGKITAWAGVNLDITERKRMEEALRDAHKRKDDFLAMLSHELRNPLASITNSLYLLRKGDLDAAGVRHAYEVLDRQTVQLTGLVDDLLDVTRISRGKVELHKVAVDLCEVVKGAVADFTNIMQQRRISLSARLPDQDVVVMADRVRIVQVVGNLLNNAAKFTDAGGVVTVELAVSDGKAEVSVSDTGKGLEASLTEKVFDVFVQGERTLSRSEGGLGLGLALVKGIVEMHGGKVAAASAGAGMGATFVFSLPLLEEQVTEQPRVIKTATASDKRRRVLVVDDNRDAADSLAGIIRLFGHEVEVVYDGQSAVASTEGMRPDIVLCDIGLPGINGYEVAKKVRTLHGKDIFLVAVTGYARLEDAVEAEQAGFNRHIGKPVDVKNLVRLLDEVATAQA